MACGFDEEDNVAFENLPPRSSPVEEILLRKSALSVKSVQGMMAACKALKRFEFTHGIYFFEAEKMTAGDIMQAILPHKDTLEYLHVNMEDDWDKLWWQSLHETWYFGTDLRQMGAIKTLVLGMQSLTGMLAAPLENAESDIPLAIEGAPRLAECLPEGIEHLQIHGCGECILEQAQELLGIIKRGERYRNLRHIRFLFNKETTNPDEVQLALDCPNIELKIVFQSADNRKYDCASRFEITDIEGEHLCSLIHRADIREEWLRTRGSDLDRSKVGA